MLRHSMSVFCTVWLVVAAAVAGGQNPYAPVQVPGATDPPRHDSQRKWAVFNGTELNRLLGVYAAIPAEKRRKLGQKLPAKIISRLNVAVGAGNLVRLRSRDPYAWPEALTDLVTEQDRNTVARQLRKLVEAAGKGT